jgi:hypothetical protein
MYKASEFKGQPLTTTTTKGIGKSPISVIDEVNEAFGGNDSQIKSLIKEAFQQLEPKMPEHKGLRYNEGKLRYDLLSPIAIEGLVRVLTKGARKYAERNWENGMSWSTVIASSKRHLAAIEAGEDYDPETGELHIDHLQCNSHFLSHYYKRYPQGDDRQHKYLKFPKIGLDIDEVLCDFVGGWCNRHNLPDPESWHFDYLTSEWSRFNDVDKEDIESFYLNLEPKVKASDIPFEPHCYITSRSISTELTKKWLQKNGFPTVPVYTVHLGQSKVEVAKKAGIEWFIDDRFENFVELNKAGICTFLWDSPWNRRYEVGYKRITSFNDLKERFL